MRFDLNQEVKERSSKHRRKQRWHKRVSAMAAVVVFCTTYALILPAITMEKQVCELEEHIHAEACYVPFVEESRLELKACSLGGQLSGDAGEQIGEIDLIVHTHDELCYDADGQLMCGLEEVELHRHTADCYESVEPSGGDAPAAEEPPVEEPPAEEPPVEEPPAEEPADKPEGPLHGYDGNDPFSDTDLPVSFNEE